MSGQKRRYNPLTEFASRLLRDVGRQGCGIMRVEMEIQKMNKLIAAAAGLSVAAVASAQVPFNFNLAESGNSDNLPDANPITPLAGVGGNLYEQGAPFGSFTWDTGFFGLGFGAEADTALGLYLVNEGTEVGTASVFPDPIDVVNGLNVSWFFNPANGGQNPFQLEVFLGRFSVENNGTIAGQIGIVGIDEGAGDLGQTELLVLDLPAGPGVGPAASANDVVSQDYQLRVDEVDLTGLAGIPAGVRTYDVFVQAIPAPGAAALLGFAGVAAARRRR